MFCENCGNQMTDGSKFCPHCGAKIEEIAAPTVPEQEQANSPEPIQQPEPIYQPEPAYQPEQNYQAQPQPAQPSAPIYQQPAAPQQVYQPQQPGAPYQQYQPQSLSTPKSSSGNALKVVIIVLLSVLIIGVGVVIFALLRGNGGVPSVTEPSTAQATYVSETVEETTQEETAATEKPTEKSTEKPTEKKKTTKKKTSAKKVGRPKASEFDWAQKATILGPPSGAKIIKSQKKINGKWKAQTYYQSGNIYELENITIMAGDRAATVTFEPYKINYGEGYEDESGMADYSYSGAFDSGTITAYSEYGSIEMYAFYEKGNKQYGLGNIYLQDGGVAYVSLVRNK